MTDLIIPQSPITAQSNPIVPPAPVFKKKTKWGKMLVSLVALVVVVGGGVWAYMNMTKNYAMIAVVGYPSNYCGTRGCPSGTSCKNNQCVSDPVKPPSGGGGGGGSSCSSGQTRCSGNSVEVCSGGDWHGSNCTYGCANGSCKPNPNPPTGGGGNGGNGSGTSACPAPKAYFMGVCSTQAEITAAGAAITELQANGGQVNFNTNIITAYNPATGETTVVLSGQDIINAASHAIKDGEKCFPVVGTTGGCANGLACYQDKCIKAESCASTDGGGQGCPISCRSVNTAGWTPVTEPGGGTYCNAKGEQCSRYRKELKSPGANATWCFLGYGEVCGGSCGGGGTTTLTDSPTMSCTGITSVPAVTPAPVVGTKMTFTCAGTVTPASAGTLSYKFRYSINSGAVTAMTNKTATTSELTIAACGTYKVECQACATLNGVLTCSPVWTGATQ